MTDLIHAAPDRAAAAFRRAMAESPFLLDVAGREAALATRLRAGVFDVADAMLVDPSRPVAHRLRVQRRRIALLVAIGDLSGAFDLGAVTHALSDFADHALDTGIRTAIAERAPEAEPAGFVALALGKQGSRELNYSSDIDPILLFDPETFPRRLREEPGDAAVRVGRRVIELLQTRDADGYVLRVDLRLRPSPEVTPIVLSIGAATAYYESQALPWERAAFIRARAAAGDVALGERFLTAIRPFVWRRGLDFGAVGELRAMSQRIRDHYASGQRLGPGYDLKRGRGGIREIEFFAQIHQLIHGGRDPALRAPATRDALARLADAGWIAGDEAQDLIAAYAVLRRIEHRVQMIDDRQTHLLPAGNALDRVARLDGLADGDALLGLLALPVARVAAVYDSLGSEREVGLPVDHDRLAEALVGTGFAADAARIVERWRTGLYPALRGAGARLALEAVLPALLAALAEGAEPSAALARFDAMIERLPSAINLFRLLEARPPLATLLAAVLSHAGPLADDLARRPALLDGLIDASALDPVPSVSALAAEMTPAETDADYQARLDRVRHIVGERQFALGVQIVAGTADPLGVAHGYARVAEAAIVTLAEATVAEFVRAHGRVPDSELAILALGRMGGGTMTHASDLDLVYLFTGAFGAQSDGAKPLGATLYYNRLASRITAALSVPTAAGPLYAVDTRLRPSGSQGPIAVSVASFDRYQREDAWTWEHMALARGRPVYGSTAARGDVAGVVARVLGGERPARDVAAEARAMRAEMARHKPPAGPLDAKLSPGGLVDLEFAIHVAQLVHRTGFDPDLGRAIDALGPLLPPGTHAAHDLLTRMLVTARLLAPDATEPPPATRAVMARAMGVADWNALVADFERTRQDVGALWAQETFDG
ncbi:bifunctional [glutamine synthetase] adenylyltransferase/[glutamine synthetase]-adenylyl-L-tyrosine phosphorylase [uncultured Sphingomonas sp.]|uniref:bifunctional [glutamine synthetase] adenylyltransferase/[glutamine synthetase]-adenylyl-L-tyrosine phosphorylase n=1 Tax=uncultured Sphingomonas sp. TaxID=158754 RepID=UPI0035CA779E